VGLLCPMGLTEAIRCDFFIDSVHTKHYFTCGTGLFGDMKLIGDEGVDAAVLPIGDNLTMGPKDALRAIELIRPKLAIPGHYDTWPLIEQDALTWKSSVEESTQQKWWY
jgi:L-ascorbate metabolism protein UlaG (beta-lactamase superfamily)